METKRTVYLYLPEGELTRQPLSEAATYLGEIAVWRGSKKMPGQSSDTDTRWKKGSWGRTFYLYPFIRAHTCIENVPSKIRLIGHKSKTSQAILAVHEYFLPSTFHLHSERLYF